MWLSTTFLTQFFKMTVLKYLSSGRRHINKDRWVDNTVNNMDITLLKVYQKGMMDALTDPRSPKTGFCDCVNGTRVMNGECIFVWPACCEQHFKKDQQVCSAFLRGWLVVGKRLWVGGAWEDNNMRWNDRCISPQHQTFTVYLSPIHTFFII